ncbi:MAG: heavy metal-binding domain-containing protein [Candidatus Bathyarchaeia archaeon]
MECPKCGYSVDVNAKFCPKCGISLSPVSDLIITTTPIVPGYKIKKVLGVVTGLTPRTRGVLGKFIAGIESMFGGEVTAFTTELEKARAEAVERMKSKALALGANAVIGLDVETSDLDLGSGIVVISATGTAVVLELE